jgi:RNA 2',3'-cyclic 3'-phosphodiesterase
MNRVERLFLGVPLTLRARGEIESALAAAPLPIPGRLTPTGNWHITLRFIGDASSDQRQRLIDAVERIDLPPTFRTRLTGWGAFPRAARARVLWIGADDAAGNLTTLAARVEAASRIAGFPPEDRSFRPHLTLARFGATVELRPLLRSLPPLEVPLDVNCFILFRSFLGSGPARHEALRIVSLAP